MTRPSCPKWYIPALPTPLLRLRAEELQAMIIVWGAICEAIRQGQEPIFPAGELAQLIADVSGCSRRNAYRLLARLVDTLLDGKRLLRAALARESRVPAPEGGSDVALARESRVPTIDRLPSRGMVIRPGEALEPWLRLVRRAFVTNLSRDKFVTPDYKEVPPHGGGIYGHDLMDKPPPPGFQDCDRSVTDDKSVTGDMFVTDDKSVTDDRSVTILPLWRAVAARIGVESAEGIRLLQSAGIPPRRLLALWAWHQAQPGSPGVGAFLANLRANRDGMADLADRLRWQNPWILVCPACGADLREGAGWTHRCPECGTAVRECPACGELAPGEAACPWCGADPPPPPPDPGDREEPAPVWPEEIRPLAEALAEALGSGPDPGWARDLEAMLRMGVTPEHIRAAASRLRERGIPLGLLAVARMALDLASTRKEDSG